MKRRDFSAALACTAALAPATSRAQGEPAEGRNYVRLSQPVPVSAAAGKIEVIDFFWYGCPHCSAFEPELAAWAKRLPEHVAFSRVPVAFRAEPFTTHQRIFYALDALGLVEAMHRKVFYAVHVERLALDKPAEIASYMAKHGVDAEKFTEAFNSFTTQSKIKRANSLVDRLCQSDRGGRVKGTCHPADAHHHSIRAVVKQDHGFLSASTLGPGR